MKPPISLLSLIFAAVSAAQASTSVMDVTVSDAAGKLAFKGRTNSAGVFATGNLAPGNYVVQFNAKKGAVQGQYALVVSAGKQKVVADSVEAGRFTAGGVAMNVKVGKGLNITGQVSTGKSAGAAVASSGNAKVKIVNGKRYVWVGPETGSNLGGHWEEEGVASGRPVTGIGKEGVQNLQDRGSQGTLPGGR